jgi:thioredoxin-related protein
MKRAIIAFAAFAAITGAFFISRPSASAFSVQPAAAAEEIKWYTLEEAQALSDANPRKIFVDFTTSWCGWCKTMDANTFHHPVIAKYMNEHFYCVKFNAETHDTVVFNGQKFANRGPAGQRSANDFAITALQGRLSYPSFAFISKDRQQFTIMQGYMPPDQFEPYIHFYGEEKEKEMTWENFKKTFKSEIPPAAPAENKQVPAPH